MYSWSYICQIMTFNIKGLVEVNLKKNYFLNFKLHEAQLYCIEHQAGEHSGMFSNQNARSWVHREWTGTKKSDC